MKKITYFFIDKNGMFKYHLGASYVLAELKVAGYEVEHFVSFTPYSIQMLVDQIIHDGVKYCLFTCYDMNYPIIYNIVKEIKERNQSIYTIVGGHTGTFNSEFIMSNCPYIDICYSGEGEISIVQLMKQLEARSSDLSHINNISWRNQQTFITNQFINSGNVDLDSIPSPFLEGIIDPLTMFSLSGDISVILTRGCMYDCNYCVHTMRRSGLRFHSIERLIAELKFIYDKTKAAQQKIYINICDDMFTVNKERVREICTVLKEYCFFNFDYKIDTRIDLVDEEILTLLKEANITFIGFGLESANPRILKLMNKVKSPDDSLELEKNFIRQFEEKIAICNQVGIHVGLYIIYGWPTEKYEEALETYNFIHKFKLQEVHQHYLTYYKGSKAHRNLDNQFIDGKKDCLNYSFDNSPELFDYDLEEIPDSEKDPFIKQKNKRMSIISSISGVKNSAKDIGEKYYKNIVLSANHVPIQFLLNNLFFQSKIIICKVEGSIFRYYYSEEPFLGQKRDLSIVEVMKYFGKHQKRSFIYTDIDNVSKLTKIDRYLIENDLTQFDVLAKKIIKTNYNLFIEDVCKFIGYCPAENNDQVWIDNNQNVLTCRNGLKLGDFNTSCVQVNKNYQMLKNNFMKEFGCQACQYRPRCAICIKELNRNGQEYCKVIQRKNLTAFKQYAQYKSMEYFYDKFNLTKQRY